MKINLDKFYKSQGLSWSIELQFEAITGDINEFCIVGPYCLNCCSDLDFPADAYVRNNRTPSLSIEWIGTLTCSHCGREFTTKEPIDAMKRKVVVQYVVAKRAEKPKISLDDPPAQVKVRDEDDTYFLKPRHGWFTHPGSDDDRCPLHHNVGKSSYFASRSLS